LSSSGLSCSRPYDLRHAAVSLWLNGGVSPTEIAKRAGHSVEVLLRVYAKCVSGQEEIANHRIEEILGGSVRTDTMDGMAALHHVIAARQSLYQVCTWISTRCRMYSSG
jgi:hypothetical protein